VSVQRHGRQQQQQASDFRSSSSAMARFLTRCTAVCASHLGMAQHMQGKHTEDDVHAQ
jgi:hypothetical protein